MISLPDALLEEVDEEASQRHMTRSELLRFAVQRELRPVDPEAVERAIRRSRDRFRRLGAPSVEELREQRTTLDERDRRRATA